MRRSAPALLFCALSLALHLVWLLLAPRATERPVPRGPNWVEISFEPSNPPVEHEAHEAHEAHERLQAEPQKLEAEAPQRTAASAARPPQPARPTAAPSPTHELAAARPHERVPASASRAASRAEAPPPPGSAAESPPHASADAAPLAAQAPPASVRATPPRAHDDRESTESTGPTGQAPPMAARSPSSDPTSLSARSAALGFASSPPTAALRCTVRHPAQVPADCEPAPDVGSTAQRALTQDLQTVAKTVPHLRPRDPPQLHAHSDGSYSYEGHVFQAQVRPDGQVAFSDKTVQPQLQAPLSSFKVIVDVNDVVEKHVLGRELYSAEKQWFLDQTRELREQLSTAHHERERRRANRALEQTLQDIVADDTLTLPQKHDALYALWQDCGEDAQAQEHRRSVEAFVRRYLPKGSTLEFRPEELSRYNAERKGLTPFEPYS